MAETAEPLPPPENTPGTGARPGEPGAGQPFKPGQSGNPGGRPKGLARKVREAFGDDDGETIARIWAGLASGWMLYIHPETEEKEWVKIPVADVIAVTKYASERGWGKPPQFVPIEDDDPLGMTIQRENEIAEDFDAHLDEVAERRRRREDEAAARAEPQP